MLTKLEEKVWNKGERLVPGRSHNRMEVVRHRSSYALFREAILGDIASGKVQRPSILDVGFGSGFGCAMLSDIPGAQVTGIDIGPECLEYAKKNYSFKNVEYKLADIATCFSSSTKMYDYVVSRGVLEHVENGLSLIRTARWRQRLMIDVPYAEPAMRNGHHVLSNITEEDFNGWTRTELFFEDINGGIHQDRPERANMIMACMRASGLDKVGTLLKFPRAPFQG